jgi:hypothetical protein
MGILTWAFIDNRFLAICTTIGGITLITASAAMFDFTVPGTHILVSPTAFSEDAWRISVDTIFSQHTMLFFLLKIPTWCGLLIVAWEAVKATSRPARTPV